MNDAQPPSPKKPGITARLKAEALRIQSGRGANIKNLVEGWMNFFSNDRAFHLALMAVVFVVSLALFIKPNRIVSGEYREGEIAYRDIYAPRDLTVENAAETEARRKRAHEGVHDTYMLDAAPLKANLEKIHAAFDMMKQGYLRNEPKAYRAAITEIDERAMPEAAPAPEAAARRAALRDALRQFEESPRFAAMERRFRQTLGLGPLSPEAAAALRQWHYHPQLAEWLAAVLAETMQSGVVAQKDVLPASGKAGIAAVDAATGAPVSDIAWHDVMDMRQAHEFADRRLEEMMTAQPLSLQRAIGELAAAYMQPNMVFNRMMTMDRKKDAVDAVQPVIYRIQKGELIVREGERLSPEHLVKIGGLREGFKAGGEMQAFGAAALFLVAAILGTGFYVKTYMPQFFQRRSNLVLLGLLFVTQLFLLRFSHTLAEAFAAHDPSVSLHSYLYAAPFALAPLLGALFYTREVAIILTVLTALSAGLLYKPGPDFAFYSFAVGLVAVFQIGRVKRRSDVWKAGGLFVAAGVAAIVVMSMADGALFTTKTFNNIMFAVLGGVLVAALTLSLAPLAESIFPVVSDIKLLELADLNHPLLARMAVAAPGTYHHSIVVGNLAEDAAEAIGANPLLARVGSYFHDIGKLHKPEYFIENQREGDNRHDNLTPSMSALVITTHVTKGLEWAREHRLIPQIQDMIVEHHGTQLIQYFYHRAKEQEGQPVNDQPFRYPGRKPQSRESAIVALADSVEAASRAMKTPTSARLEALVSKIINDKFVSGQLDDSHLTLHDLNKIGDSFVRVLHGIFHYRVEYPDDKETNKTDHERAAGGAAAEQGAAAQKARPDLRRIV